MLIAKSSIPHRLNDTAELKGPNCGADQEGGEKKMVARAYYNDVEEIAQAFILLDVSEDTVTAPTRS